MNEIFRLIQNFVQLFRFWVVVQPWEQALRVRLGKRVRLLRGGLHFKLPFLDTIYLQSVRLRLAGMSRQTLSSMDGRVVTLAGTVGYAICDLRKLYETLHHAESTITSLVMIEIAQYFATRNIAACNPADLASHMAGALDLSPYGLDQVQVYIMDYAVVKTYRLIGDASHYAYGDALTTSAPQPTSVPS